MESIVWATLAIIAAMMIWPSQSYVETRLRSGMQSNNQLLRKTHSQNNDRIKQGKRTSNNESAQGISVQLSAIIASLQSGAHVIEALEKQLCVGKDCFTGYSNIGHSCMPSQSENVLQRDSHKQYAYQAATHSLISTSPLADCNGNCDVEQLIAALRLHRLEAETDTQIMHAAYGIRVAYEVSKWLGCPAARCFEAVRETYIRLRLREDLKRNAFAVPQSTVRMLMGLPVITVILGELLGADPIGILFGSWQGMCCLVAGSICYVGGAAWMHRLMLTMTSGTT